MIEAVLLFILKAIGFTLLFLLKLLGLILLIFLVVLIIVLVTPIKIGITYPELLVYVKWNGIKYQIYPMKERKKSGFFRKKQAKKEEDLPKETEKTQPFQGEKPEKEIENIEKQPEILEKPIENTEKTNPVKEKPKKEKTKKTFKNPFESIDIDTILKIAGICLETLKKIIKGIKIQKMYLWISVAGEDKAKVGMDYGKLCMFFSTFDAFLESAKVKDRHINISADFEGEAFKVACDLIIYTRPITAVKAMVLALIKIKKEGII